MKKLLLFSMATMLVMSVGCNTDRGTGTADDNQDIQREEEMNRGDMVEDEYDQSDIGTGSAPSNVDMTPTDFEQAAPSEDASKGLEEAAPTGTPLQQ